MQLHILSGFPDSGQYHAIEELARQLIAVYQEGKNIKETLEKTAMTTIEMEGRILGIKSLLAEIEKHGRGV